jgi:PAS domain S-box-containing protein
MNRLGRAGLLAVAGLLAATLADPAVASERPTNVLLLYAESRLLPAIVAIDRAVRSRLESFKPGAVFFYTEYLDISQFDGDVPRAELREQLRRKYAGRQLDLIVAGGTSALDVALDNRAAVFSGVPIVFVAERRPAVADLKPDQDITGVWSEVSWAGTLDAALRLHPDTQQVAVVAGSARIDQAFLAAAGTQLVAYQDRLEIIDLTGLAFDEVRRRVAALPERTILLIGTVLRDRTGRNFVGAEAASRIAAAAKVPAYGLSDTYIGGGIVGGHMLDFAALGARGGDLALRVLRGDRQLPIEIAPNLYLFDWRQLQRWGLDERRLPQGSVVRFREPSVWDLYKRYIIGGVALLVIQSALITGLVVHRVQRRRAEQALAERLRFETFLSDFSARFSSLPASEVDEQIDMGLARAVEHLGLDRATLVELGSGRTVAQVTHSATREGVPPIPSSVELAAFPWMRSELLGGRVVRFFRREDLPGEAAADCRRLAELGIRSLAMVPLTAGGSVVGALGFSTIRAERQWPDQLVQRLQLLAEVFANALARLRAARAVRESEERFRTMADGAPIMVWLSAANGRRTYVNRRWLEFTGRGLDDELGEGWTAGVHPDDREVALDLLQEAVAAQGPFTIEYRLRRGDGEYRWILDHGIPRRGEDGGFSGYIGSAIDITDLRTAQQALIEADTLRSTVFASLGGHVAAIDRHGVIIAVNQAWTQFAAENGVDPARVSVGANYLAVCREAAARGNLDASRALEAIRSVLEDGGRPVPLEYACHSPSEERWFEMGVEPFRRPEGGAVISHVDVTRRRQAEEEARRQREALAHALRVTTLGELAASLAHEINQPLAAVLTNAQAARRLLDDGDRRHVMEALTDIADDAKRASQIIRRLRSLFRKEHTRRVATDVNELLGEVVGLLRRDLERRRIVVSLPPGMPLPPTLGDPVQLRQVVLNLLVNSCEAIEAAADGPREITIETGHPEPGILELSVRDTGIGVKEAELPRIFEQFVTSKPDGLGMGLSIARSIVEAHGGRIWATRNLDRGLTVHVTLPGAEPGDSV